MSVGCNVIYEMRLVGKARSNSFNVSVKVAVFVGVQLYMVYKVDVPEIKHGHGQLIKLWTVSKQTTPSS